MNLGLNGLVALIMAVALSACATGGSSPADTAAATPTGKAAPAATTDAPPSSKPIISAEPECD